MRVPSHDDPSLGGHAKRWNLESGRNFHAQIIRFIEEGSHDFEDFGGFVRWSVLVMMDYLERLDPPRYPSNVQILKAISSENAQSQTRREYLTSIERSSEEAFQLVGLGMEEEAVRHVSKILEHVRSRPKGDAWRQLYEQAIKLRFGHLFKRAKIDSLAKLIEPPDEDEE